MKTSVLQRSLSKKKSEKTMHRMGENISNHIPDKGLISRIYEEFLQLNNRNNPVFKMGKECE